MISAVIGKVIFLRVHIAPGIDLVPVEGYMHQRMWSTQIRFNGINNEGRKEKNEKGTHSWVD